MAEMSMQMANTPRLQHPLGNISRLEEFQNVCLLRWRESRRAIPKTHAYGLKERSDVGAWMSSAYIQLAVDKLWKVVEKPHKEVCGGDRTHFWQVCHWRLNVCHDRVDLLAPW